MSSLLVIKIVYRLEIHTVSHVGIFDPSCELAPLFFSLVHLPPPLPCVNKYRGMYLYSVCVSEGKGPQTDKHLPPNPFTGQCLRNDNLWGLLFLKLFGPCQRQTCNVFFIYTEEQHREVHLADWFWMDVQDWSQCCKIKDCWHAFHWWI